MISSKSIHLYEFNYALTVIRKLSSTILPTRYVTNVYALLQLSYKVKPVMAATVFGDYSASPEGLTGLYSFLTLS